MQVNEDLARPDVIEDPYQYYGRLRENHPVYYNEKWGGYIVTRYDNVKTCFQDSQHLTREKESEGFPDGSHMAEILPKWMLFRDPPAHTRLRALTMKAFNRKKIDGLRPTVRETARTLIEDIETQPGNEVEFISEFAYLLPVRVISKLLGIPLADEDQIQQWSSDLMLTIQHFYGEEDRLKRTEESIVAFSEYLREIVADRRDNPQDDLITHLLEAQDEGQVLDDDEVIATAMLLLVGGHETTTNLIANGVRLLLQHPDQMTRLRDDPELIPSAVEEILRYEGTLKAVTRHVTEDFELAGTRVESGNRLMLNIAAANRDPRKFDDPETFDVTRNPEDHVAFGGGIHYCIGAPLARQESAVALSEVLSTFPQMELATDEVEWGRSVTARAMKDLPIRV
jgi:cytochrome P450